MTAPRYGGPVALDGSPDPHPHSEWGTVEMSSIPIVPYINMPILTRLSDGTTSDAAITKLLETPVNGCRFLLFAVCRRL